MDASEIISKFASYTNLLKMEVVKLNIQLPNDLFYNTGIATYIWIVSKEKAPERKGKVQLIDAGQCYEKRRKSLGNKRVEITDRCRELIVKAYKDFANQEIENGKIRVESRIKDVEDFKYRKVFTYRPLRLEFADIQFDEQRAAGMKGPDIALLKDIASACTDCNELMNDYEFFSHLKKEKVKIAQGKVAMIRNFYGKRNPAMPEAYVKPTDKSSGYAPDSELKDSEIITATSSLKPMCAPMRPTFGMMNPKPKSDMRYRLPASSIATQPHVRRLKSLSISAHLVNANRN